MLIHCFCRGSIEPGLVVSHEPDVNNALSDPGDHMHGVIESRERRIENTANDFAMLTHIASAAAAAGS